MAKVVGAVALKSEFVVYFQENLFLLIQQRKLIRGDGNFTRKLGIITTISFSKMEGHLKLESEYSNKNYYQIFRTISARKSRPSARLGRENYELYFFDLLEEAKEYRVAAGDFGKDERIFILKKDFKEDGRNTFANFRDFLFQKFL